ncbi:MAG: iron uptake system protein EfeO [Amaricoccus sp.]
MAEAGQPLPARTTRLMLAGAGGLVLVGAGAFWLAAHNGAPAPADGDILVTITDAVCQPAALEVPAGRQTFRIHNTSDRALEWEIFDGVMVVAERENIAPGLSATLTERLRPGEYAITCGLLSNPRGTLKVLPTAASEAGRSAPETRAFLGPLAEYRVYLSRRSGELVAATATLSDRIAAGDLDGARAAWLAARQPWRQVAPVSGRIADLANTMDPLADYLAEREKDPGFTGFHRIEYGLWVDNSTDGLQPVADRLEADAAALRDRLRALSVEPADLAANAAALAGRVAHQASGSQAPYSHADLAEYSADLDGIAKSALLVGPLVTEAHPATAQALQAALDQARATLDGFKQPDGGFPAWSSVDAAGRAKVSAAFATVATAAAALNPAIGLE